MEKYENKGIKEIIAEFPEVGAVLEQYGIGCGPCTVGMCQLKDILEIHQMEPEQERELMLRIESVIYPERNIQVSGETTVLQDRKVRVFHSLPMQKLVGEHVQIKRWLALIPFVVESMDLHSEEGQELVRDGIDLIQSYADKIHHGKEEDVLFAYFDDSSEIFQVIYRDHKEARRLVKDMLTSLEASDVGTLKEHLLAYRSLLTEHIKKEDEILFPWLDRELTAVQIEEIAEKFIAKDKEAGIDPDRYELFLDNLEQRFIS
ncbi:hemerythrin domain-containing protein [Desulfomarina sp.]